MVKIETIKRTETCTEFKINGVGIYLSEVMTIPDIAMQLRGLANTIVENDACEGEVKVKRVMRNGEFVYVPS
jgi:hypothetical protein